MHLLFIFDPEIGRAHYLQAFDLVMGGVLELRMDDGSYRRLEDLSGGQRVSVLLSLWLETRDERPLVIDQPEDELDNRFLFDTVLPALKRLKGRRQIIVATHDANIVVNGDADQVIQLEASSNHGRVAETGAIEDPAVRDAIVRTVDGGDDAFRLRRLKYGFESYRALAREDRHLLPRAAIREAIVNAVTHRDYAITGSKVLLEVFDSRVDVTSPGALPNHMTVERVRAGANPRSRNDSMAYFMAAMGFMEQRGRGWMIMQRQMREFNGTEPELLQDERNKFVRVTFRLAPS